MWRRSSEGKLVKGLEGGNEKLSIGTVVEVPIMFAVGGLV